MYIYMHMYLYNWSYMYMYFMILDIQVHIFYQSNFLIFLTPVLPQTLVFIIPKYYSVFEPHKILDIKCMLSLKIIVTEPDFPYLEALAPFQPLQMKVWKNSDVLMHTVTSFCNRYFKSNTCVCNCRCVTVQLTQAWVFPKQINWWEIWTQDI